MDLHDAGSGAAYVAEALDGDCGASQVEVHLVGPVLQAEHHALTGGFLATGATTRFEGLPGTIRLTFCRSVAPMELE
ncbi:MAG: hypothetical protein CM1200mP26_06860 [Acidimicrobiales bacterium]|nr:MAG: hypothetical protein CM1200mP26_06860 [Acidimicrobiales bacterium]